MRALCLAGAGVLGLAFAPPAAAHEYLAYFAWNSAELEAPALAMAQEAASYGPKVIEVQVVGHADRSGSPDYNRRLSERRARAVADALVRAGLDPAIIVVIGRGETQPVVQTPDGVREPLNRRVTVHHALEALTSALSRSRGSLPRNDR